MFHIFAIINCVVFSYLQLKLVCLWRNVRDTTLIYTLLYRNWHFLQSQTNISRISKLILDTSNDLHVDVKEINTLLVIFHTIISKENKGKLCVMALTQPHIVFNLKFMKISSVSHFWKLIFHFLSIISFHIMLLK